MREKKMRIVYRMIPLLFLLVILSILAAGRYDRTFLACGPEASFSLDRGTYRVHVDTPDPAAVSCDVCYEVNGQEQILASTGVKSGVGVDFEISLPSNIRNDSVRVVLLDEDKNSLPQIDTLRITRVLPVRQTVFYLVLYLAVAALLYKGFDGGLKSRRRVLSGMYFSWRFPLRRFIFVRSRPLSMRVIPGTMSAFIIP